MLLQQHVRGIFPPVAPLLFAAARHVDFREGEAHYAADKTWLKVEMSRERTLSALIPVSGSSSAVDS